MLSQAVHQHDPAPVLAMSPLSQLPARNRRRNAVGLHSSGARRVDLGLGAESVLGAGLPVDVQRA